MEEEGEQWEEEQDLAQEGAEACVGRRARVGPAVARMRWGVVELEGVASEVAWET